MFVIFIFKFVLFSRNWIQIKCLLVFGDLISLGKGQLLWFIYLMDRQVSLPTPLESFLFKHYLLLQGFPHPRTFWRFLFLALVPLLLGANGKYSVCIWSWANSLCAIAVAFSGSLGAGGGNRKEWPMCERLWH